MLAKIQRAQRALRKRQAPASKKDPGTHSPSKAPLKRPWSKLTALAGKKQQASKAKPAKAPKAEARSKVKPAPPPAVRPRKKQTP